MQTPTAAHPDDGEKVQSSLETLQGASPRASVLRVSQQQKKTDLYACPSIYYMYVKLSKLCPGILIHTYRQISGIRKYIHTHVHIPIYTQVQMHKHLFRRAHASPCPPATEIFMDPKGRVSGQNLGGSRGRQPTETQSKPTHRRQSRPLGMQRTRSPLPHLSQDGKVWLPRVPPLTEDIVS